MNLKVDVIESEEGPGYGAAILAAVGCGAFENVERAVEKTGSCGGNCGAGRRACGKV